MSVGAVSVFSSTDAFFKIRSVFLDVIYRTDSLVSSLSGNPVMLSGLVIVTDASVSVVTTYDLCPVSPSAFTL